MAILSALYCLCEAIRSLSRVKFPKVRYAKETIGKNLDFTVGGDVTFKVGASTVKVCQSGTIEITGTTVKITGATVNISGGSGDCKINGVSLVNHKHEHDGSAKAGPYTVSGNTGVPVK